MVPDTRSEKEKMIAGDVYRPGDPHLSADRQCAKALGFRLNQTCPTDTDQHRGLSRELLPNAKEAWVESPFHCDYGYNITTGKGFYANQGCTLLDCAPISIGDNVVVGAGSVVVRDLPANSVCVGSPARPVRFLQLGEQSAQANK
jgi:maltose O-acetyltransferase